LEVKANSETTNFIRSWKRKQKIFYCFHIAGLKSPSRDTDATTRWERKLNQDHGSHKNGGL